MSGARRVLVTGGSGFIGRHVLAPLGARGFDVIAPRRAEIDLLDPGGAQQAIEHARPTHLLHLAWTTDHAHFWTSKENATWVEASLRLLRAFAAAGGNRAVVAGTCAEYAWGGRAKLCEDVTPLQPATLYGAAKHGLHTVAAPWARQAGLSLAWGRIFFLHGPGEAPGRLVSSVARALIAGEPPETSSGRQEIDLLHVSDVAAAFAALVDGEVTGAVNVGSGGGRSVRAIAETLAAAAGREDLLRIGARPDRPGDPPRLVADVTRLREEVGVRPALGFAEGLAATLQATR